MRDSLSQPAPPVLELGATTAFTFSCKAKDVRWMKVAKLGEHCVTDTCAAFEIGDLRFINAANDAKDTCILHIRLSTWA